MENNALTVWQKRFSALALTPDYKATEATLFAAEAEMGKENLPVLIDRIPVHDLRVLAESADSSANFALLEHLSPQKLAELLDYQARYESRFSDRFSPFPNILFGTFFSDRVRQDKELQEAYLDAIFRFDLAGPILNCIQDGFGGEEQFDRLFSRNVPRYSEFPGFDDNEYGVFTEWYLRHCDEAFSTGLDRNVDGADMDTLGPKEFLLRVCDLRPEYARLISDVYTMRIYERDGQQMEYVDPEEAPDPMEARSSSQSPIQHPESEPKPAEDVDSPESEEEWF